MVMFIRRTFVHLDCNAANNIINRWIICYKVRNMELMVAKSRDKPPWLAWWCFAASLMVGRCVSFTNFLGSPLSLYKLLIFIDNNILLPFSTTFASHYYYHLHGAPANGWPDQWLPSPPPRQPINPWQRSCSRALSNAAAWPPSLGNSFNGWPADKQQPSNGDQVPGYILRPPDGQHGVCYFS